MLLNINVAEAYGSMRPLRNSWGRRPEKDIVLSLPAPYYISLSSLEEEKRQNSPLHCGQCQSRGTDGS